MSLSIFNIHRKIIHKLFNRYRIKKAKERVVRYKEGRDTYYLIRVDFPMAGLFAIAKSVLCHIEYALDKGWIPVVDLCNSVNQFKSGKRSNPWELFFEQPMNKRLDDITSHDNLVISCKAQSPNEKYILTVDALLVDHETEINAHSVFYNKYIRLSKQSQDYIDSKYNEIIGQRQHVLGVLCRGTDYLEKKPVYHPVQPEPEIVIEKIKELQKTLDIEYIYLATEDSTILQLFKDEFGIKLLYIDQKRLSNTKDAFISDMDIKLDDKIKMNMDYMASMNILSRCDYLIGGRTSGTIAACLMNNKYKYKYLWDLGLYQPN